MATARPLRLAAAAMAAATAARGGRAGVRGAQARARCSNGSSPGAGGPRDVLAELDYQAPPPPAGSGRAVGRYIAPADGADTSDLVDEHERHKVRVRDARALVPEATLESRGFELRTQRSAMCGPGDFRDPAKVRTVYYPEVEALVKAATGCERVLVFDHTLREGRPAQARAGGDGAQSLNVLGDASKSAAAVRRVHCDYSAASAPARLRQIVEQLGRVEDGASGGGAALDSSERAAVLRGRYAFINVWRSVDADAPVQQDPLAMCDARSVRASEAIPYKMVFPERVGENLALQHGDHHKWFFYPQMTADEALVFKVYDSREAAEHDGTRFTYHTAFSDPTAPADARPRRSIEVRTVASFAHERPPHFFDMKHSNNAARVRLWLSKKGLPEGAVQTTMVKYDDLQTEEFGRINPLRKVPALLDAYGGPLIESAVILDYLEDKFAGQGAAESFTPGAAEERALVRLLIRIHDTYIASPNSTQPGFSHTQGAMYLAPYETPFCPPWRAMDRCGSRAHACARGSSRPRMGGDFLAPRDAVHVLAHSCSRARVNARARAPLVQGHPRGQAPRDLEAAAVARGAGPRPLPGGRGAHVGRLHVVPDGRLHVLHASARVRLAARIRGARAFPKAGRVVRAPLAGRGVRART